MVLTSSLDFPNNPPFVRHSSICGTRSVESSTEYKWYGQRNHQDDLIDSHHLMKLHFWEMMSGSFIVFMMKKIMNQWKQSIYTMITVIVLSTEKKKEVELREWRTFLCAYGHQYMLFSSDGMHLKFRWKRYHVQSSPISSSSCKSNSSHWNAAYKFYVFS